MYSAVSIIENLKSAASLECEGLDSIQCPNTLPEIECPGGSNCEKGILLIGQCWNRLRKFIWKKGYWKIEALQNSECFVGGSVELSSSGFGGCRSCRAKIFLRRR